MEAGVGGEGRKEGEGAAAQGWTSCAESRSSLATRRLGPRQAPQCLKTSRLGSDFRFHTAAGHSPEPPGRFMPWLR
jgi:hypothetical protein